MSTRTTASMPAVLVISASALFASGAAAVAQSATGTNVPNFIDARPLPQTDRARSDELEARRKADDELKRLTAENDAKRRSDEETKRIAADADAKRLAAEAEAKRRADEETKRLAANADATRLAAEADAKRRAEDDAKRVVNETDAKRVAAEAEARRKADEDGKRVAAETQAKRVAAEAEAKRVAAEAETKRLAAEAETKRLVAEADARRAVETNRLAAEAKRKAEDEIRRTAAAPVGSTDAQKAEIARLIVRGRQLMSEGDIFGARLLLGRAATFGDADAALALADTYDTAALGRAGAVGVAADPVLVKYWRSRAQELGGGTAAAVTPQPEARPPPASAATAVATPASAEALRFVARGKQMLQNGDVDGARLFFERAMNAGAAEGALELGTTFDPVGLRELGAIGLQPNPTRAAALYRQAQQMGAPAAVDRLRRLEGR